MNEILTLIFLAIVFQCGGGILYGIAAGFDPALTFIAAISINLLLVFLGLAVEDRVLNWKKSLVNRLQKSITRAKSLIEKYGWLGIPLGAIALSPLGIAIVSRFLGVKPRVLYPSIVGGTILVGAIFLAIALGLSNLVFPR